MARGRPTVLRTCHHDEKDGIAVTRALVIIEERVPSARVLLDVVVYAERLKHLSEPAGGSPVGPVPGAIAGHDGTGTREEALGVVVPGHAHAIVHAGRGEPVAGGEQQGEPAADAKADDTDLARAPGLAAKARCAPLPRPRTTALSARADRSRGHAGTSSCRPRRTSRALQRGIPRPPASWPGCAGPGSCPGVVDDNHPWPGPHTRWHRQIGGHRPARARDRHIRHHASRPAPGPWPASRNGRRPHWPRRHPALTCAAGPTAAQTGERHGHIVVHDSASRNTRAVAEAIGSRHRGRAQITLSDTAEEDLIATGPPAISAAVCA